MLKVEKRQFLPGTSTLAWNCRIENFNDNMTMI